MQRLERDLLVCLIASTFSCSGTPTAAAVAPTPPHERKNTMHEAIIKGYFGGWEKKSWETVASYLAEGFTFTSPTPDDHIPTEEFRRKCWNQAEHIQRFDFVHIAGDERAAFALVHVVTKQGHVIRNTEFFTFEDGKIRSIEVFFGGTGQGFPTNTR